MQGKTLLITSKDKTKQEETITLLLKNDNVDIFDTTILKPDGSIGIAEIRILQKNIFLKPLRGTTKACIIYNAHNLTIEAQNALLKLLEEPPDNTIIILAANDTNAFLPTVLSRCTIINETEKTIPVQIKNENIFDALQTETIGQKLKHAQDLAKNKDEAIAWMENAILTLRQELINGKQRSHTIRSFQDAYITLKTTNTNLRLTLENLFLNI